MGKENSENVIKSKKGKRKKGKKKKRQKVFLFPLLPNEYALCKHREKKNVAIVHDVAR